MAKTEESALQKLKADMKANTTQRLYFFYGDEMFLLRHYVQQLKKLLIDELTESFNYHCFTAENFDLQSFADAVENLPMMAENTLVQVDDVDYFKLPESDRDWIQQIFDDIPDYCTVVFTYETVQWKPDKRFKKLWDTVCRKGAEVEFAKQSQRDLVAWITRHFAAEKKNISSDLCMYLLEITDGTMTSLSSEIKKICAYSGADVIKKSDIDAVTEPVMDAVVFRMTDMLGKKQFGPAMEQLQQLFKMQEEPIAVLGAVGGHFRRLSTAKTLLDHGKSSSDLLKLYPVMGDYGARKTMEAARRFSVDFLRTAAELVLETDNRMKTSFDDKQRLLEMLILQLAGEARNG